ncbi:virion structural protein [Burkholderia phage Bm1]
MTTFTFDPDKFRAMFPFFKNGTTYPDDLLQMFWDQAQCFFDASSADGFITCGNCTELALYLMAAHIAAVMAKAAKGKQGGYDVSATIDKVSVSRLAPPAKDMWEWWLSQSPYGQQFMAMMGIALVGGLYVGGSPEQQAFRRVGGFFFRS